MGRKRIGIIYRGGKGWIGGVYYIQNIINALNTLSDKDKPIIDIYADGMDNYNSLKTITGYPYLVYNRYRENKILLYIRKSLKLVSFSLQQQVPVARFNKEDLFVYPTHNGNPHGVLPWIPDFQERYLPELFDKRSRKYRYRIQKYISEHIPHLILSSEDCANDFKKFYPDYKCQIHVLRFAVTLPDYSTVDMDSLRGKYGIHGQYLFCPNQFWMHKNHMFLFKTFQKALSQGLKMQLVCTGQLADNRNPKYIQQIKNFLVSNHLENNIKILGFIEREEMLCLIQNSYAVVQPSLFEGWSTVVEDAKAVNKFIFLSDLRVHREQIDRNVCFFNPRDEEDLCRKLLTVKPTDEPRDYQQDINAFGQNFLSIINKFE